MASGLQDVSHGDRAVAADRLGEGYPRARDLVRPGLAPQLRGGLDDLVGAARPHRVAARLEAAAGRERDAAAAREAAVGGPLQGLPPRREAAGFEGQRGNDGEGVVRLEEIEILGSEAARRERLLGRPAGGAPGPHPPPPRHAPPALPPPPPHPPPPPP